MNRYLETKNISRWNERHCLMICQTGVPFWGSTDGCEKKLKRTEYMLIIGLESKVYRGNCWVSEKMCLSLIKGKIKTTPPIFKIVTFLNQDFYNLNFDVFFSIFLFFVFILALLNSFFALRIGEDISKAGVFL